MREELWRPSPERIQSTLLARFMQRTGVGCGSGGIDYDELWRFSISEPELFWAGVWDFCDVIGTRGETVFEPGNLITDATFFRDARLNYAENLLGKPTSEFRLIFHGENGLRRELGHAELSGLVGRIQQALQRDGIGIGDRVVGVVPNTPESAALLLAVTGLGAVWSSCSPDFGKSGILDRFGQLRPKVMFCADGYFYNGKWFETIGTADEVAAELDSVGRLVVCPYEGAGARPRSRRGGHPSLSEYIEGSSGSEPSFVLVGFNDPGFILFSSGTTGLPKCIVHGVGGTLLQHLKEHQLQCDIKPGDRVMFFTTCGWMMWNWLMSAMASEASLVLFDGSPFHPGPERLATIAEAERVTHFGASAKYFDACSKAGVCPVTTCDLASLRTVLSTGSPLSPEAFDYVYSSWKADLCLSSIAGGTDIIGCFVGGSPVSPVFRGQCQKRHLGMNVGAFDECGDEVVGKPGELVCRSPHPSMPVGFLNDPGGKRYQDAYFSRFPNVWHHGDWVELTDEGGLVFYGRSDATLNPGGVRIGTAEIYRPVEGLNEVVEALVVGVSKGSDTEIVLFVRLRPDVQLTQALKDRIRQSVRQGASPRHVPSRIIAVPDIPRTKSGKIVELAVRDTIEGRPVRNTEALANPEALEHFRDLPELDGD